MKKPFKLWKRSDRNGVYYCHFDGVPGWQSTAETNETAAQRWATKRLKDGREKANKTTLADYLARKDFFRWDDSGPSDWISGQHLRNRRFSRAVANLRQGHVDNWIVPKIGNTLLEDLDPDAIDRWLLKIPRSNSTRNAILSTLAIVLRQARRERLIRSNPVQDVERLGVRHAERKPFAAAELIAMFPPDREALLRIWGDLFWGSLFLTMAGTGARSGEIRALAWQSVRLEVPGLVIVRAVKGDGAIGPPKTEKGTRAVFLPKRAAEILTVWREATPHSEPESLVWFSRDGRQQPLARWTVSDHFHAGLENAGVPSDRGPHHLRHTYISMLRRSVPDEALQFFVGHSQAAVTDGYTHQSAEDRLGRLTAHRPLLEKVLPVPKKKRQRQT